jgi:hypothetical protein
MYDVYLSARSGLLVVPRGNSIPSNLAGDWRGKKRTVRSVSKTIREDIQRLGYYRRRLAEHRPKSNARNAARPHPG